MSTLTLFFIICAFIAIKEIMIGVVSRRRRKHVEHLLRVERTQSQFAKARNVSRWKLK